MTCPCCRGKFQHAEHCTIAKEAAALVAGHGLAPQIAEAVASHGWRHVQLIRKNYEQRNSGDLPQDGGTA
jgi:hypothetical protein